jgi:O-antigen/teichoic acid export membrane protein
VVIPAALGAMLISQLLPGIRLYGLAAAAGLIVSLLPVGALLADERISTAALALAGPNAIFVVYLLVSRPSSATRVVGVWALVNMAVFVGVALMTPWLRPVRSAGISFRSAIRDSFPLGLANIVGAAYGRVDILLVSAIVGAAAAGAYAANYRIVLALIGLGAWTSNIEARRLGDPLFTVGTLRQLLRWAVTGGVAVAVLLALALPLLVGTLLSPQQELPVFTSALLALLVIPHLCVMPLAQLAILRHRERELARLAIIVGGSAVIVYPLLISLWGVGGAALASLLLETLTLIQVGRVVIRILAAEKPQMSPE